MLNNWIDAKAFPRALEKLISLEGLINYNISHGVTENTIYTLLSTTNPKLFPANLNPRESIRQIYSLIFQQRDDEEIKMENAKDRFKKYLHGKYPDDKKTQETIMTNAMDFFNEHSTDHNLFGLEAAFGFTEPNWKIGDPPVASRVRDVTNFPSIKPEGVEPILSGSYEDGVSKDKIWGSKR